jgi:hypothetical protein
MYTHKHKHTFSSEFAQQKKTAGRRRKIRSRPKEIRSGNQPQMKENKERFTHRLAADRKKKYKKIA